MIIAVENTPALKPINPPRPSSMDRHHRKLRERSMLNSFLDFNLLAVGSPLVAGDLAVFPLIKPGTAYSISRCSTRHVEDGHSRLLHRAGTLALAVAAVRDRQPDSVCQRAPSRWRRCRTPCASRKVAARTRAPSGTRSIARPRTSRRVHPPGSPRISMKLDAPNSMRWSRKSRRRPIRWARPFGCAVGSSVPRSLARHRFAPRRS